MRVIHLNKRCYVFFFMIKTTQEKSISHKEVRQKSHIHVFYGVELRNSFGVYKNNGH